ncbi:MAG TPA: hypothetical protein VER79_05240, partial [Candidatus Limnocylindrales bacterium]|nr:hypothetical protein [Candidatus Limnocylindrales bacterium]
WADERGRYSLHELLRQFAEERLAAAGEAHALREAHSRYTLEWAVRMEAEICGPNRALAHAAMDADWHNLRAALLWAASHQRPQWITPCWKTLYVYHDRHSRHVAAIGLLQEVTTVLRALPESQERDGALGIMLMVMSTQEHAMWNSRDRDTLLEESLPLLERGGSPLMVAGWYVTRGTILETEDVEQRSGYLFEGLTRVRALGDPWCEACALNHTAWQGFTSQEKQRHEQALQDALQAQSLAQATGDLLLQSTALNMLGMAAARLNLRRQSVEYFTQSLAIARLGGSLNRECISLNNLALQQMNWGALETAQTLMETSLAIRREVLPFSFNGYPDLGEVFLRKGEFERASPLFAEGESRFERLDQPRWTQIYLLYRVRLAFCLGQWDALALLVHEMQAFACETGETYGLHFALATAVSAAFAHDDESAAHARLVEIEVLASARQDRVTVTLASAACAELKRRAGHPVQAAANLRAVLLIVEAGTIEPITMTGWENHFTPLQAHGYLVRALLDAGELDEARTVALTALDNAYAIKAPPFVMGALLARARVEAASGDPERAAETAVLIANSPLAFASDRLMAAALQGELTDRLPAGYAPRAIDWEQAAADCLALAE